mmetsp:Transcript_10641/g.28443  ORF Transcript_10641/g.28443 Transcript_10641/m.28443 type:complete len:467 (+) Transcript_10641:67-1467(+)
MVPSHDSRHVVPCRRTAATAAAAIGMAGGLLARFGGTAFSAISLKDAASRMTPDLTQGSTQDARFGHGRSQRRSTNYKELVFSGTAVVAALAGLRHHRIAHRRSRKPVSKPAAGLAAVGGTEVVAVKTPPIWVVNLDKSVDRWKNCQEEFATQDLKAERFPATLGKAMTDIELAENTTFGARYFCTPGMIGCFMSHLRIWQKVAEEGHAAVIVLEDDVVLFPNFSDRVQMLLKELPDDWEVCLLGAVGCIAQEQEAFNMKLYGLITGGGRPSPGKSRTISPNVFVPYRPAGTHAYMVSRKGAQALLRMCPKPRYHVDLTAWSLEDLKLYAAKDFLATQRFDDDTTVSKEGAPLTRRFLRWCWDFTGLAAMGKKAGVPNLTWAWTIACFAVPLPFSRKRIIVEMGPATSLFVLMALSCIPLRSMTPLGFAFAYLDFIIFIIRGLAGTQKPLPLLALAAMSAACFRLC